MEGVFRTTDRSTRKMTGQNRIEDTRTKARQPVRSYTVPTADSRMNHRGKGSKICVNDQLEGGKS